VIVVLISVVFNEAIGASKKQCVSIYSEASRDPDYMLCEYGITSLYPLDNATGLPTNITLSISFENPTTKSTGNLRVYDIAGVLVQTIPCSTLAGTGTTFSSPLTLSVNRDYYIRYDRFCFANATSINDSETWNFSTRQEVNLVSSSPASGENDVCLTQGLTLNFNQPVYSDQNNKSGTIRLSCNGSAPQVEVCSSTTFTGSGTGTLFKPWAFPKNTFCNIRVSNNCIHNAGNDYWLGAEINFQTNSTQCNAGVCNFPIIDPPDNATGVRVDSNMTLDWNNEIWTEYNEGYYAPTADSSLIEIRRSSDNSVYAQYDLALGADNTSSMLNVAGANTSKMTIDPKVDFPASTAFYMNFTGVPLLNCPPFAISDNTTWNFTTGGSGPVKLISKYPRKSRLNVANDTNLELNFDSSVFRGSGSLRIYEQLGDVLIDTISASSSRIYGIGTNSIRIFPVNNLVLKRDYYITMDEGFLNAGSVTDPVPAIEEGDWSFRTIDKKPQPFWKNGGNGPGPAIPPLPNPGP
jgi:hypothetical protein